MEPGKMPLAMLAPLLALVALAALPPAQAVVQRVQRRSASQVTAIVPAAHAAAVIGVQWARRAP